MIYMILFFSNIFKDWSAAQFIDLKSIRFIYLLLYMKQLVVSKSNFGSFITW